MANGSIQLSVGLNVDKTAINQLKTSLQEIQRMTQNDLNLDGLIGSQKEAVRDLEKVKATAKEVEKALDKAFNKDLGTLNVSKFNQELSKLGLKNIYTQFNSIGSTGQAAFRNMTTEILTTNLQLKQSHKFLNEIATTMGNTIKWGMASSIMNSFSGSIQQAYGYVKALDSSLNDIRIVTGKSSEEMAEFARQANKAAQSLGQGTKDYTEASLIYYQQGLSDAEASARAETTLKAANVTGQSTEAVSEQLTAVWNGYKVSSQEAELYVDKLAAVAATTASDLEELSVGMSKVASAANAMGVDVDSLNAQLATIISVTRQAPESAGTALKTIYARMGDIEAGIDGEVTLDEYTSKMADMGVNVLNMNGQLRDMGEVINEIGGNWKNLSREQQISLSQTMAGTRQYNNLLALFDNWDMYEKALNTSANAMGTLQNQQDIYMESTEAHLQQLRTATEDVYDSLFNAKSFNVLLDGLTFAVNGLADFVDGIGGGGNALLALGSIATTVFSKQISSGIMTTINNFKSMKDNAEQVNASMDLLAQFKSVLSDPGADTFTKQIVELEEKIMSLKSVLSEEDFNKLQNYVRTVNEAANKVTALEAYQDKIGTKLYNSNSFNTGEQGIERGEDSKVSWEKIAKIGEAAKGSQGSLDKMWAALKNAPDKDMKDYFTGLSEGIQSMKSQADKATIAAKNLGKGLNSIKEIKSLKSLMKDLSSNTEIDPELKTKMANAYQQLLNPKIAGPTRNALSSELTKYFKEAASKLGKSTEEVELALQQAFDGLNKKLEDETNRIAKEAPIQNFVDQLKIKELVEFAGGVMQVTSGLTSLGNAIKTLENPDLEPMEKFAQILSGIGMGLPMLYSGLGRMLPMINSFTESLGMGAISLNTLTLGVLAVTAALTIAYKVYEHFAKAEERAANATKEAIEAYDKEVQVLDDLNSKLQDVNDKIDELHSKGELSLTDKNELSELESESIELEHQIALQEQLNKLKQQEIVAKTREESNAGAFKIDDKIYSAENQITGQSVKVDFNNADAVNEKLALLKNLSTNAKSNGLTEWADWYDKQITQITSEYQQYLSDLSTSQAENKIKLQAVLENPEGNEDLIQDLQKYNDDYYEIIGQMDDIAIGAFESADIPNLEGVQQKLQGFSPSGENGEWVEDDLRKAGLTPEQIQTIIDYIDVLGTTLDATVDKFTNVDLSVQETAEHATKKIMELMSGEGIDVSKSENAISNIVSSLSEDWDFSEIIEAIGNVDWSQIKTGKDLWIQVEEQIRQAAQATEDFNANTKFNSDIEKYGLDRDELESYKKLLAETDEELAKNQKSLNKVAIINKRMEKGVKALAKNWDDFNEIMSDSESSSEDVSSVLPDIEDALKDILSLDTEEFELLPPNFAKDNWDLITDAVNGVEGGVERLRDAAQIALGEELLLKITPETNMEKFNEELMAFNEYLATYDTSDFRIGVPIEVEGNEEFYAACQDIINAAGMTQQEATKYFGNMGYDVEFTNEPQTVSETVWEKHVTTKIEKDEDGNVIAKHDSVSGSPKVLTGTVDVPTIKTITPNGNFGGGRSVNSTAPRSARSSGGGGGGGGGGSKKPKKEKPLETKKDRYHDVNIQLAQIDEELEDIGRDQEKLFGKDLINALNKELQLLEKQKEVLQDKLDIARQEQAELKAKLALEGVTFNEDGTIANYLAIVEQKEAELNALIEQYNSMSAEEQETFQEEVLDPAKEAYEELIETMEEYDTVITDTIPEIENAIQDAIDREVEINIKKLNMEVELRLDLSEAQKDWNEFKRKVIDGIKDDDIFGTAQSIKDLYGDLVSNGTLEAGTANINTTIAEINKMNSGQTSDIYGDDKQAALDNLEEQMKNLMDTLETLTDLQEELAQKYLESIDKVGEAFDEQIASYEYVGELIEHNLNLAKLIKGEDAFSDFDAIYKQQEQNNLSTLASQKQAVDYYRQMMETEQDPEALKKWTELWKESVSTLNSTVESSVELVIEKYSNTINIIFDEMDKALTNGKGLDYMTLQWELVNDNADAYLDTINAAYEVQKLERSVIESLNNTDSLYAQKKLNDFMEDELKMLREKEKLTQYDVDRANALYDIKLKEIALEEAQQNKSQMRLRRDSSGNYSYQFVADQDSIGQAQQELDDAKNSLYNMDKDAYRENQQAILDAYTEYQEKMRDAANLSAEERELIEEQYNEKINGLLEENNVIRNNLGESAFDELAQLYNSDEANFRTMSQNEKDILIGEIIPHWNDGINEMIKKMAGEDGFATACKNAMEQLEIATVEYDNSLKLIETTAGQSFGTLAENQAENIQLAKDLAEATQEVVNKAIDEKNAVDLLKESVDALAAAYDAVAQAAEDALTAAQALMEFEKKKAADAAAEEARKQAEEAASSGGQGSADDGSSGGGSSTPTETPDNSNLAEGVAASIWLHGANASGWGKGATRAQRFNEKGVSAAQALLNKAEWNNDKTLYNNWIGRQAELKKYYYKAFDTGGYTGEWGDEGKLAVLHEKELILNKDDTKNILTAVSLARTMDSILSSLNDSIVSRVSSLTSMLTASPNVGNSGPQEIQQNVSIEANFPNVSSRTEIEDAFKNLVNVASQHAFNTQR